MSAGAAPPEGGQPSEEELRARLEEELRKITVRDVLVQTAVTLIDLAGRRLGLTEATRDQRDLDQARMAIEALRALMPVIEQSGGPELAPLRDALSQLQMHYAAAAGSGEGGAEGGGGSAGGGTGGPSRREQAGGARQPQQPPRPQGGLWVPPGSST